MNPTIKNHKEKIIGYKAFKKDGDKIFTDGMGHSKRVYFEENGIYETDGLPVLCENGFHFFRHFCFAIDYLEPENVIHKIETIGDVQEDTEKCVTNKIKILGFCYEEFESHRNNGDQNNGDQNNGDQNNGDQNNGDQNNGYRNNCWKNNGDKNNGYQNNGDQNNGDQNNGDQNNGWRNTGWQNNGSRNTGWQNNGSQNNGNKNNGSQNNGYQNNGDQNNGSQNNGWQNNGDQNNGDQNNGWKNNGSQNNGSQNNGDKNNGSQNNGNFNYCNGFENWFCTKKQFFLLDKKIKEIPQELKNIDLCWFELKKEENFNYKKAWSRCPAKILDQFRNIPIFKKEISKEKFFKITGLKL
jgi:hypothetical protein